MLYFNIIRAEFLQRLNRFVARVLINGAVHTVHVKNTGRCRELLVPGATVYLEKVDSAGRKTQYDLVAVEKQRRGSREPLLINMDAQAPNKVFQEWALAGKFLPELVLLRPEQRWGNSRFDFYFGTRERRGFIEVKGVTLEIDGHARFPDAPTERGVKHIEELIACQAEGYEAYLCFVIQMAGMKDFAPNDAAHRAFGAALRRAREAGVKVLVRECQVTPDMLEMTDAVPLLL